MGRLHCPLDRIQTVGPSNEIPINYVLREVIGKMEEKNNISNTHTTSKKSNTTSSNHCEFCTTLAVKYCQNCKGYLCEVHLNEHSTNKFSSKHETIDPYNIPPDCPNHSKPLELYCSSCQKLVCSLCIPLAHQNHGFISIDQASAAVCSLILH